MAKPEHVAEGVMMFAEAELLPALDGWRLWTAGAALMLAGQKIKSILDEAMNHKAVAALGLVDEDGEIDIDAIGTALKETARKHGKMKVDIPVLDIEFTFTEKNVDALLGYIKKAGGDEEQGSE